MSCVPRSTICPCSTTRIWSARRMVERRCAITKGVRPCMRYESPCWIISSDSESRLEVASSRIKMRGSARLPRDRDSLPLSSGKLDPAFAHNGVVFLREAFGKFIHAGDVAGAHDFFFAGAGPGEGHILTDRAVKQERLLQHHAQARAIRIEANRAQVHFINQDFPICRDIKS